MKTPRLIAACVLSASPFVGLAEVRTGDSLADVHQALGAPRGQARIDGRQVLYYERGEVELQADTVTRVALRSPEEQLAHEARAERNRGEREARLNQLVAEGVALRDRKLADENFKNAPLVYQVSYWENFSRSYPGVSVIEPLTIARMRLNEQLEAKRANDEQVARLADLEARLAETESNYYPFSSSFGYGYGRRYHPYIPMNLMPVRYDFRNTSSAPYETPRGAPYETPRTAPYATPTAIDFNQVYRSAPAPRADSANDRFSHHGKSHSHRGRDQVAQRDGRSARGRY
jgi:hypothetical protein